MPSNRPVHLVLLGCGYATEKHSATLRGLSVVQRSYASRDGKRAREFCERFKGARSFSGYAEAIAAEGVDAVLVATPPDSHLSLTLAALSAGRHVIVEKPPFLNSGELDQVRAAARSAGRRVMVAENYFYKPLTRRLRELVTSGVIGTPRFVHLVALKTQSVEGWRADPAVAGGGALFEGGIHWIDLAANLGLELESASALRPGSGAGPERSLMVTLRFAEGAVGTLLHSWETPSLFKGLRLSKIYGSEGSITFESNGLFVLVHGRRNRVVFPGIRDISGYRAMFEDFLACVRTGDEPVYNLDRAAHDLRLVEQAYASLEPGPIDPSNPA